MKVASSSPSARWAVGLALGVSWFTLTFTLVAPWVESADVECASPGVTTELAVNSTSDAAALKTLLDSCEGGVFDVTWHGRVAADSSLTPFIVSYGTSLNITGVAGRSSSSQLSSDDDSYAADSTGTETAAVIEGNPFDTVFDVQGALSLDNLVLEAYEMGESSSFGGAIYAYTLHNETSESFEPLSLSLATVNIIDCTFRNYTVGYYGGVVFCEGCELNIHGTSFTKNYFAPSSSAWWALHMPSRGGAIYAKYSEVHIGGDTTFTDSWASHMGGAIYSEYSELHIEGSTTFTNNRAQGGGGAIFLEHSELHIDGGVAFTSNSASSFGGGAIHSEYSKLHIDGDVTFTNNVVASSLSGGGAILSLADRLNISGNTVFSGNTAEQLGGAIAVVGPLNLSIIGTTFTSNWVEDRYTVPGGGGAVWVDSAGGISHYLENLVFDNNSAENDGGALFLSTPSGWTSIRGSIFHKNVAVESGGALFHHAGYASISDTNFTGNMAGSEGLAMVTFGTLDFPDSETIFFANNSFFCPLGQYAFDKETMYYQRATDVCSRCGNAWMIFEWGEFGEEKEPVCEDLPIGVKASSSGTTVSNLNLEKGYYRISVESRSILECDNEDACVGGDTVGQYCTPGYEGPSCTVCADTYAPGLGYSCHKCEGPAGESATAIGAVVIVVIVMITAFILVELARRIDVEGVDRDVIDRDGIDHDGMEGAPRTPRTCKRGIDWFLSMIAKSFPLTAFKTVIVVWQIVTQFAAIAGDTYPEVYDDFVSKLNVINVDIGFFVSSSCVVRTNFYHRLLIATLSPMVILLVLRATYGIAKKRNEGSQRALLAVKQKHLSAGLFIAFFIYPSVSFTIFQTFVCDTLDDGVRYLRADYSLTCSAEQHSYYLIFAIAMVFVYPIGIPFWFWRWINWHKEEQEDRDTVEALKPFQGIWSAYKPSRYFYEIVEFGRRITLTGVAVFVIPGSSAQIAIVLLLAVVFLFVSESLSPFSKSVDMGLYRWGNGIVLGSMYVALLLKFDASREEDDTLSAFAGVLVAANVFMAITVIVQSYLMVKEWRQAEKPLESPDPNPVTVGSPSSSSVLSKQAICLQDHDEAGGVAAPLSPFSAGVLSEPGNTQYMYTRRPF